MPNPPQSSQGSTGQVAEAIARATTRTRKSPRALSVELQAQPADVTLLELVLLLGSWIDDDREVADTARRMLERGEVRLVGNFRGEPIESFIR